MSRVGIVLQARMGSSRLPGKVLAPLQGRPMLAHILERLQAASRPDLVIVATSDHPRDLAVAELAEQVGVACFRGSETDVLDRYYRASQAFELDHVVRATADNPFVDPWELDRLVGHHLSAGADYTHAFGQLPIGVGVECFAMAALEASWRDGTASHHREHVNEYVQEHPERFAIHALPIPAEKVRPELRLTVDTPEDFRLAERLYEALWRSDTLIRTEEAIARCAR